MPTSLSDRLPLAGVPDTFRSSLLTSPDKAYVAVLRSIVVLPSYTLVGVLLMLALSALGMTVKTPSVLPVPAML